MFKKCYTGLLDHFVNKVREGDILITEHGVRWLVYYDKGSFKVESLNSIESQFNLYEFLTISKAKVIGSKYDNEGLDKRGEIF